MTTLVLGATSPIARALATLYAEAGHDIYLATPEVGEVERIASDIHIRTGVQTRAAAFDALDVDGHADFVKQVEEELGPIEVVVLAFGFMGSQSEAEEDFTLARRIIDINYTGAASVAEAVAARMVERGRGAIIGISSVAGDRGRASNYFYGSAKGAFTLYLQGLRNRLFEHGVQVMTAKLGFVDTRMTYGMETGIPIARPASVARALFKAQQRGSDTFYYPHFWRGIMGVIKAIPERMFKRMSL